VSATTISPVLARAATDGRLLEMTRVKTALLRDGLRVDLAALDNALAKPALRVRSGSCGGLDLILDDGTWVNAPVRERFARSSPFSLVLDASGPVIHGFGEPLGVELVPAPAYYTTVTASGAPMMRVGQLCSDRVGVGLTNICTFWRSSRDRCRFCSIGSNVATETANKALQDAVETICAAVADPIAPARHVLLGGGTPNAQDAGIPGIAEVAHAVRQRVDVPIYAMVTPPADLGLLQHLADAGVDELGMNIEVFSADAARRYIPGKHAAFGLDGYWRALERAVSIFGPVNTRSITVIGLEDAAVTVTGVRRLAELGVMPILSPHRPLDGTQLADHARRTADELWDLTLRSAEAAADFDIPLGPTCIACQSNTLTVPGDRRYRLY
jgi:hypothetical protein